LPSVNRAYNEFKEKGLQVYLVDFRESADAVRKTVAERGYTAPVLLDINGDITGRGFGVWGPPTFFFLDKRGQIIVRGEGERGWDRPEAKAFLRDLLALP
jgi:hypothetical protein